MPWQPMRSRKVPPNAGFFLPGLMGRMPSPTLYLCVVDPGVGGAREVLAARVGDDWLLGPDNGLLVPSIRRDPEARIYRVRWRPEMLSDSFHGRDLFAPIAAAMAAGDLPDASPVDLAELCGAEWPPALSKVCYVDVYGNLISGLWADAIPRHTRFAVGGLEFGFARTFCEVPPGMPFWYRNAFGLLEIAANQARADRLLGLVPGDSLPPRKP